METRRPSNGFLCLARRIAGRAGLVLLTMGAVCPGAAGQGAQLAPAVKAEKTVTSVPFNAVIPRIERAPTLEDFLEMKPGNGLDGKLLKIESFIQRDPKDGEPATQRTEVYLGYDDKNLYAIFVAFDSEPAKIRARLARRENIYDDDRVEIMLDTFRDQRRAYSFVTNPLGIQLDRLYAEGSGTDEAFDTLWYSHGKLTPQGYVVWMAIPFRSLRFSSSGQPWGIILQRVIPRSDESSFWPRVSSRVSGRLNQEATLEGFTNISPGRNIQLIPYAAFRSFRAVDQRDPNAPRFENKRIEGDVGLDAKFVVKDRVALDFTVNPDFSQVESDQPQTTVNQRFEVFFPEKRPFFLENSNYFDTPINLLFTRRIADPMFGTRATGKLGKYAVGLLFADDQSPGKQVPDNDPLAGKRAYFGVARVNRDIFKNSTLGMTYTERRLRSAFNRVGGMDARFKFGKNWDAEAQAVTSSTRFTDGTTQAGPAYHFWAGRNGRKLSFNTLYQDNSRGFLTETGFFRRPNLRRFSNFLHYGFRPEGKHLINHGFNVFQLNLWDHNGLSLERFVNANYFWSFARQTEFGFFGNTGRETLRPSDFSTLTANQDYPEGHHGMFLSTSYYKQVSLYFEAGFGKATNFEPASGPPVSARSNYFNGGLTLRPISPLTIDNTYILTRLRSRTADAAIFNDHIIRSKWNYQLTRELSLRFIAQYNATLANGQFSSLENTKRFNVDFLVTYLAHPGTAIYVGYNSGLQNLDPSLTLAPSGSILRTRDRFINDGRQIFVKLSYLIRR